MASIRRGPGEEDQTELADLDLVAVDQHRGVDRFMIDVSVIDVSVVEAVEVDEQELSVFQSKFDVVAADGGVVEEDVAAGMSAHRGQRLIQQNRDPALGPCSRTISAEPAGGPVGSGSTSGRFDPRVLFRWAKLHALFVCAVAKPGPDLWRMARDARSFELGSLLAARRDGARRFPY